MSGSCIRMGISILQIYSTHMWKKYTTPISRNIATYSVGISEMAMPVFVIILCIILVLLHVDGLLFYSTLIPLCVYILVLIIHFRIVGRLDRVLECELREETELAMECAQTIRAYINRSTAVTVVVTVAWALFAIIA